MNRKSLIISTLISTIAGGAAALIVCLVYFTYFYKPVQTAEPPQLVETTEPTPPQMPAVKVHISEINSVALRTDYTGFYEENSKCGKSYNELSGYDDKYYRATSPCRTNLSFDRNGNAAKSVEIESYDKTTKQPQITEKSAWKAKITAEQFNTLVKSLSADGNFIQWTDEIVERYNNTITATHKNGVKQTQSYIENTSTADLPMVDAFKRLEGKIKWTKIQ